MFYIIFGFNMNVSVKFLIILLIVPIVAWCSNQFISSQEKQQQNVQDKLDLTISEIADNIAQDDSFEDTVFEDTILWSWENQVVELSNSMDSKRSTVSIEQEQAKRVFAITAKQWEFNPSTIKVKKWDLVVFLLKSMDVAHSIKIEEFNVDQEIRADMATSLQFVADKKWTFSFSCSTMCWEWHSWMTWILIVE